MAAAALIGAPALAVASPEPVAERNLAWLLAFAGLDAPPEGEAALHVAGEARSVPAAEAFRLAAARAGDADLAALAAGLAPTDGPWGAGDVWVIEVGTSPCPVPVLTPVDAPVPATQLSQSFWTYEGPEGTATTADSIDGLVIDWTTKMSGGAYARVGSTIVGQSDFFCFESGDTRLWFPFLNGLAWANSPGR